MNARLNMLARLTALVAVLTLACSPASGMSKNALKLRLKRTIVETVYVPPPVPEEGTAELTIGGTGRQPIAYNKDGTPNITTLAFLDVIPAGNSVTLTATGLDSTVRAVYAADAALPAISPSAAWTGTAGTGFGSWTDCDGAAKTVAPTLTGESYNPSPTAPIARIRLVPGQRATADFPIDVVTDGYAQIDHVDIIIEGGCTRVTQQTIRNYLGSDKQWSFSDGWHARINLANFLAKSTTGTAQVYAIVTSTDPTAAVAVVGGSTVTIKPRTNPYTFRINIDEQQANCVYTAGSTLVAGNTWPNAWATCGDPDLAMRVAVGATNVTNAAGGFVLRPVLSPAEYAVEMVATRTNVTPWSPFYFGCTTCTGTSPNGTAAVVDLSAYGWPTLRAEDGVTYTIKKTSYDFTRKDTLFWQPKVRSLRLQGPGILHDQSNGGYLMTTYDQWYDGITVPIGDYDPREYLHPDGSAFPNSVVKYTTGGYYPRGMATLIDLSSVGTHNQGSPTLVWDAVGEFTTGDLVNSTTLSDNVVVDYFGNFPNFSTTYPALRVWYDGPNGAATVTKTGTQGSDSTGSLSLISSPDTTLTFNTKFDGKTLTALVGQINAYNAQGWHAELCTAGSGCTGVPLVVGDRVTDRSALYIVPFTTPVNVKNTSGVSTTYKQMSTQIDIHQDTIQFNSPRVNRIYQNTQGINGYFYAAAKMDGDDPSGRVVFRNWAFHAVGDDVGGQIASIDMCNVSPRDTTSVTGVGNCPGSSVSNRDQVIFKNYLDLGSYWQFTNYASTSAAQNMIFTSAITQNINYIGTAAVTGAPVMTYVATKAIGGTASGKVTHYLSLTGKTTGTLFPNYANHDWSPADVLVLEANLKPPEVNTPYDIVGQTFRSLDAMGPAAMKVTSETITKDQAVGTALVTYAAATDAAAGTLTLQAYDGPGNTGTLRELDIAVAIGN